jgi:hypothetical protein
MKKTALLCFLMSSMVFNFTMAQTQFQNSGFETWTVKTIGSTTFSEPNNWYTLNPLKQFGFDESTTKSSDSHSGTSAAFLETIENNFGDLPGLITIGNILDATGEPDLVKNKIAFTSRPTSINFWVKSLPEIGDSSAVSILLTKWNTTTKNSDTIAFAQWSNGTAIETYTQIIKPLTYLNSNTPDSVFFIASSSIDGFTPTAGSRLWLDDIYLNYAPLSVSEVKKTGNIQLFPNPCKDLLNIVSSEQVDFVEIYDNLGRLVTNTKLNKQQIEVAALEPGVYFIYVGSNQNNLTTLPKKFIKE